MIEKSKYQGFQYAFVIQCHGLIDHAQSEIIMTCRIEDSGGRQMDFLRSLNKDENIMKAIDIGNVDLLNAPYMSCIENEH